MVNLSSRWPGLTRWPSLAALLGALALLGCDIGKTSEKTSSSGAGGAGGASSDGMTTTDSSAGAGLGGAGVGPASASAGGETAAATTGVGSSSSSTGGGPDHLAPNGYYVLGNTIYDASNQAHVLHGMARPSMEWSATGEHVGSADFQIMKSWGARIVRIALNQDFWLASAAKHNGAYAGNVDQAVQQARQLGLDVILDLHWSDKGNLQEANPNQQRMADQNSITFWSEVAAKYKSDGRVLFELYNEPHDVPWDVWRSGGASGDGFTAAGMQQLYDAVRATGADNLVFIGGLDFAFDLSGVPAHRVQGYNIVYASHPYDYANKQPGTWDKAWGFLAATDPVALTEFGTFNCSTGYYSQLIQAADAKKVSWTAWAWYPGGCGFPSIINDWSGTPSEPGKIVKAALLGYP
ncbi:MAG: cellulase family glycosylhydrolase [Byssovorax sp.]